MAVILSARAELLARNITKKPQIILEIEGIDKIFAINPVFKFAQWDDPDLKWDQPGLRWDSSVKNNDALQYISLSGTSKEIAQQLRPDKGVAAVSVFNIELVDKYSTVSKFFSFENITEILGRKATVYFGFSDISSIHPIDSIPILRGYIDEFSSGNGSVNISVSHPSNLARQSIFFDYSSEITAPIDSVQTTISVLSTVNLYEDQDALTTYVRIDDEIMKVLSIDSSTQITVERAQLGSFADSHDNEAEILSVWRLQGRPIELALKIMLSNDNNSGTTASQLPRSIRLYSPSEDIEGAIIFEHYDIEDFYGLAVGDQITLTGINAGTYTIESFLKFDEGSAILVDSPLIPEGTFTGNMEYKSQFNVLPMGFGLGMTTNEVDVKGHLNVESIFFTSFVDYDFRITEQISDANDWINKELFYPQGLYSLPRKARVSVKMTNPPFSNEVLPSLDSSNIQSPEKLKQSRSTHREYYNNFLYKYHYDVIQDKFLAGDLNINDTSRRRFGVGFKQLLIESNGLRKSNATNSMINIITSRYSDRYKNSLLTVKSIELLYRDGIKIEVGDAIPFGGLDIKLNDLNSGKRGISKKLYEVKNKSVNITDAKIKIDIAETNFGLNDRYAVISCSSDLDVGSTTTKLIIKKTLDTGEYYKEYLKWEKYYGQKITIRNDDYTYFEETTLIGKDPQNVNALLIESALSLAPSENYLIEPSFYDDSDIDANDLFKLDFVHLVAQVEITSVTNATVFEVDDASKLFVGSEIYVHSPDYANDSFENLIEIEAIIGNEVTLASALPFTPSVGDFLERSNFLDSGAPYLII